MPVNGEIPVIRLAQVFSIDDSQGGGRIKVKLYPEDTYKSNEDIPYAFPCMPKMFFVKPKVGETVLIITAIANDGNSQRYYFGPVISQLNHLEDEKNPFQAKTMIIGNRIEPDTNPEIRKEGFGAFPNDEDVCVLGRKGAELQLKENEARIRAGVRATDITDKRHILFNQKSPSYIKLKFHDKTDKTKLSGKGVGDDGYETTATIVADKINLIGNYGKGSNGKNDTFDTKHVEYSDDSVNDELLTDEELNKILENAHKIPFGDVLVSYLKVLTKALKEHRHNYVTLPPDRVALAELELKEREYLDNEAMLSDNVRIN